jgi:hypothetical protein
MAAFGLQSILPVAAKGLFVAIHIAIAAIYYYNINNVQSLHF